MDKKPQVLVKFQDGAHVLFNIDNHKEFERIFKQLNHSVEWIVVNDNTILRKSDLVHFVYCPEGYAASQQVNVSQG